MGGWENKDTVVKNCKSYNISTALSCIVGEPLQVYTAILQISCDCLIQMSAIVSVTEIVCNMY